MRFRRGRIIVRRDEKKKESMTAREKGSTGLRQIDIIAACVFTALIRTGSFDCSLATGRRLILFTRLFFAS